MKFTLKERSLDEARPAKPRPSAVEKATLQEPYILPKDSKKSPGTVQGVGAPPAPTAPPPVIPAAPSPKKQGLKLRTPIGAPTTDAPVYSMQAQANQTGGVVQQATDQTKQAPPQADQAQQPPAKPAKPDEKTKEKTATLVKKFLGIPWFSKTLSGNPKMAQALMGATNKAQQYAGTPNYIPVLRQGFINAGVPKAEADKAAREAAKADQPNQPAQQGQQAQNEPVSQPAANGQQTQFSMNLQAAKLGKEVASQWLNQAFQDSNPNTQSNLLPSYTKVVSNLFNDILSTDKTIISFREQKTTDQALSVPERYDNWTKNERGLNSYQNIKQETLKQFEEMLDADKETLIPAKQVEKNETPTQAVAEPGNATTTQGGVQESKVFRKSTRGIFVLKG